jgi:hypothetical protein
MYQLRFPQPWADGLDQHHPAIRRVRTAVRRTAPLGPPPLQAMIPMVRLWDGVAGGDGKSTRKCSPYSRARTINVGKFSKRQKQAAHTRSFWDVELDRERPKLRAECMAGPSAARPCPFVSCRHHMALTVDLERGSIKENFPDLEIVAKPDGDGLMLLEQMHGTCSLDIADKHDDGTQGVGGLIALYQISTSGKPMGQTPGMTIEEVGTANNVSVERIRQLGSAALQEMRVKLRRLEG